MVSVRTCSGIAIPGMSAELVGIEIPVTSQGNLISVLSVMFLFGHKLTEVNCV